MFICSFKRVAALLLTSVFLCGVKCEAADSTQKRPLLFEDAFENEIQSECWSSVGNCGDAEELKKVFYTTNQDGIDILSADIQVHDAVLTTKFSVEEWNTHADAVYALSLRTVGKSSYRMAYYPQEECVQLEYVNDEGEADTIFDTYSLKLQNGESHSFALSVKDCMLRGEIDGAVVLAAADYDGIDLRPEYGGAAVESCYEKIKIEDISLTGEDRIAYMNYNSDKLTFGIGAPSFRTAAPAEIVNGCAKLAFNGTAFPGIFFVNSNMDENQNTRHTLLSFDMSYENGNTIKQVTHARKSDYSYVTTINKEITKSTVKAKQSWKETNVSQSITAQGKNMKLGNNTYHYETETKTADDNSAVEIKCSIDGISILEAIDEVYKSSLSGGFAIYPEATETKGIIYIDNLIFRDMAAETTTTDTLFSSNIEDWAKCGDVVGETEIIRKGFVYKISSENDGKLLLNNKKLTNICVSADINVTEAVDADYFAGIYARYVNEENYLLLCLSEGKLQLREVVNGIQNIMKEASLSETAGESINIELQAMDGNYRGYADGDMLIEHQASLDGKQCEGTVGIGGSDCEALFDNFSVNGENRIMHRNEINEGASVTYKATNVRDLSHTRLNAQMYFQEAGTNSGTFQLSSRLSENGVNAYTAHFYPTSGKMIYRLMTPDWKQIFVTDTDISSYLNLGEYNVISLDTQTLADGDVRICLYVNGILANEKTDTVQKFLPENGYSKFQVRTKYENDKANPTDEVWLEDMNQGGEIEVKLSTDASELTEGANIRITAEVDNASYEGKDMLFAAALYSKRGTLVKIEFCPFTAHSGKTAEKDINDIYISIPSNAVGGRLKAICVDDMDHLNMMCKSIGIK